jgi:hypothetical protein
MAMKTKIIYLILSVGIFAMSCQKMTYDQQFASTYPINGEWTIKYEEPNSTIDGPFKLLVYNTSLSNDSIWLEDSNFWPFKFKAKADVKNLSFATDSVHSSITLTIQGAPKTFNDVCTIKVGKIINKDSIYFEVGFESDPGRLYKIYGHRRTSYEEYMGL